MNKDYKLKRTGSLKCDRPTTVGHILAHIENARKYFGIESRYWGGTLGLNYDERFPNYIQRVTREIDIRYSANQDRLFKYIEPQEVDYATEEDYSGEWPHITRDYSSGMFKDKEPDKYADDERQVQIWVSNFDYMLHDGFISYIYAIGEQENDKRSIPGTDSELRDIAVNLANWKSDSRQEAQREHRREIEKELGVEWKDGKPYIPAKEQQ